LAVSTREPIAYGAGGALTTLAHGRLTLAEEALQDGQLSGPMPNQVAADRASRPVACEFDAYNMRSLLKPRRLTIAMWDVAYALRHQAYAATVRSGYECDYLRRRLRRFLNRMELRFREITKLANGADCCRTYTSTRSSESRAKRKQRNYMNLL